MILVWSLVFFSQITHASPKPDGKQVFQNSCSYCHGVSMIMGPTVADLSKFPKEAIVAALTSGPMRGVGKNLTVQERDAVARFLSSHVKDETKETELKCSEEVRKKSWKESDSDWTSWGNGITNSRHQETGSHGLNSTNYQNLHLKWSLGLPDTDLIRSQPTVFGNALFVASETGSIYALNSKSGCLLWKIKMPVGVRNSIVVGQGHNGPVGVFGDYESNIRSIDLHSGKLLWTTKVEDHAFARITASPTVYKDTILASVSSFESLIAAKDDYPCCTFRGSVVALDLNTGEVRWKRYTIQDAPSEHRTSANRKYLGPAGVPVWNPPTIDEKLNRAYFGTGENYTPPVSPTSDAIIAVDLNDGKIVWTRQTVADDVWNLACMIPGSANCAKQGGHDFDFGAPPILTTTSSGKRILLAGQKSGWVYALDPDQNGQVIWAKEISPGTMNGGVHWGMSVAKDILFVPINGHPRPDAGGLVALQIASGEIVWRTPAPKGTCLDRQDDHGPGALADYRYACSAGQSAPVTTTSDLVLSPSLDGHMRIFDMHSGQILWDYDTYHDYKTINGIVAHGGSIDSVGAVVTDNWLYFGSGYGGVLREIPGNVILAFTTE